MMEIFRILDEIEIMIKESKRVPITGAAMVDGHLILDRLDRIRAILPEELQTAKLILQERERIVSEACAQADEYIEESRDKVARLIDENEITKNAMQVAEEIVARAEEVAKGIRKDANEYAEGVLTHMELVLKRGLEVVSAGKAELNYALKNEDY